MRHKIHMLLRLAARSINLHTIPLFALIYFLLLPPAVSASNIIAVQSLNIPPYNDALKGFENVCVCEVERFILSEMKDRDIIKELREARPDVILAAGPDALNKVKDIKNTPIVYMMVLAPQPAISGRENITGINMYVATEKQLSVLQKALPGAKNIGVLYDPDRTGDFVNKARMAAAEKDIGLIAVEVHNSKDVPGALRNMTGKIDAFWMLPDMTVIAPDTVEFLFLFNLENRIPVITFSDKYLELGAVISLEVDPFDIGKQAWDITKKILSGAAPASIKKTGARESRVTVNQKIAKKLEITIGREILDKAKVIDGKQ
ncbi:MAG: ABC transporter substrate-binding protein [Nitrospirae bacterium]|nr:ABC transporter substrate-binding protein [Nitrospirota bacterium]